MLDEEEDLEVDDMLLCAKFWNSETKELGTAFEIPVKSDDDVSQLIERVASHLNIDKLDIEVFLVPQSKTLSLEAIAYEIT